MRTYLRRKVLQWLLKPHQPLKDDSKIAISEICRTPGYRAILDELETFKENHKDITWLSANYGKMDTSKIGTLGASGIMTAFALEAILENLKEIENSNK